MWAFLAVGLGAALGAWVRWGLSAGLNPIFPTIPGGTLVANLAGGYAVGLAVAFFSGHPGLAPEWRLFAVTGLLGGLTTFSTFSAEVYALFERGRPGWALSAAGLHLAGSLLLTGLGLWTYRALRG